LPRQKAAGFPIQLPYAAPLLSGRPACAIGGLQSRLLSQKRLLRGNRRYHVTKRVHELLFLSVIFFQKSGKMQRFCHTDIEPLCPPSRIASAHPDPSDRQQLPDKRGKKKRRQRPRQNQTQSFQGTKSCASS